MGETMMIIWVTEEQLNAICRKIAEIRAQKLIDKLNGLSNQDEVESLKDFAHEYDFSLLKDEREAWREASAISAQKGADRAQAYDRRMTRLRAKEIMRRRKMLHCDAVRKRTRARCKKRRDRG